MRVVPVLVAYHSVAWVRVAVESYLDHFPGDRVLVIDNNPRRGEPGWVPDCERERVWLAAHPGVVLADNPAEADLEPGRRTHGLGLDAAAAWCRRAGADVMLLFEPDCLVTGRQWRDNLVGAVAGGAWMAGSHRQRHNAIHPAPSAWRVAEIRASFTAAPWADDEAGHPRFTELVDLPNLYRCQTVEDEWIRKNRVWDTGHKAWFEAAARDRAVLVPTPGLRHYWHGSWLQRYDEPTLRARYPELRPYLDRAARRDPPRPVADCPFRNTGPVRCRLLREISGAADPALSEVPAGACEACCAAFPPSAAAPNPVVASLLYDLAERVASLGGVDGCDAARAAEVRALAELHLDVEPFVRP